MASLKLGPALGSYGPGDRNRRDGTSEGVAVATISRQSGKQAAAVTLQGAPFGVPPPSLLMRARSSEPSTHAKAFAGSDDARPWLKDPPTREEHRHCKPT